MSCPSTVHETYGHVTWFKQFNKCIYRQHHQNISMVILVLYKGSWWGTPHWGLQSSPNIHEHTYQKKYMVIDTKIVEIRKPQAELAETICLCWHLLRLLHHRHMVTPPRAFVKFWTLPNYLSVTNLTYLIRLGRLSSHVLQSRGAQGPSKMNRASSVLWQKHVKWCE